MKINELMKRFGIIALTLVVSLAMAIALTACGGNGSASSTEGITEDEGAIENRDGPLATVMFASDYQQEEGFPAPAVNFAKIVDSIHTDGKHPNGVVICGDYTNDLNNCDHQLSPDENITELKSSIYRDLHDVKPDNVLFVQGNHDKLTDAIAQSGLHEFDDYLVYIVNTENDFPWKQGKKSGSYDRVKRTADDMTACFAELIEKGETRPVFITGHVPLHFTARTSSIHKNGDNLYASMIFEAVNEAAQNLDIVYFTGHNHSKGWDCYLGGSCIFKNEGDTILIPEFSSKGGTTNKFTEETLNFTYLNAGYLGYYANCSINEVKAGTVDKYSAADETLTSTVVEIYPDHLTLTRYDADGVHDLGSAGEANPYRNDKKLIPAQYYSEIVASSQEIKRKRTE